MDSTAVRELTTESAFRQAYPVLSQLREFRDAEEFLERLATMRQEGYRLFAAFEDDDVVGVVGVAIRHNFYNGRHCFVYDLVTAEGRRGEGVGTAMLDHVHAWARERDCEHVSLESGLWRERAHGFYEDVGYEKFCYSFRRPLD